ncbi:sensor histidine kinase [Lederbergia sp. NSJ-179]|uniref:sensor histidine kinase n=1 Tax=Lederbergia sp. NSJ-179 TaxID=2931402 RepID=UPI001FD4FB4F|nr:histidine kinase [Lederbergia sp. NSJ-179]MCJ7839769.1 sensor histidine kinase [Lederbergia sp. NSJ-179]
MRVSGILNYFNTIKNKIFTVTLLLLFLFTITSLLLFHYFSKMYEERIYAESAESLHLWSTVLDKEFEKVDKLSFQISTDRFIQAYLQTIKSDQLDYQGYKTKMLLTERLVAYANMERYITSVQVTDYYSDHYIGGYDPEFKGDFKEYTDIYPYKGANVWASLRQNSLLSARQIRRTENLGLDHLGILGITIDMNSLLKQFLNEPRDRSIVIANKNDILYMDKAVESAILNVIHQEASGLNRGYQISKMKGKKYFITFQTSDYSHLTYYNILPYDNIAEKTKVMTHLMFMFIILMILLTVYVSRRSAKAISKPIEALTEKMKQVQNGRFEDVSFENEGFQNDEIGQMQKNFKLMLEKINELIKENYQKQLIIKETQYKALQAQINPHFLYNTLDSINWLARVNKLEKISNLAEALGNMMRNIISKKAPLITIEEEFDIIHDYITIQKYRYQNRLHFTINEIEGIKKYSIPKLTIQPIVENAIQHGLEEIVSKCEIEIDYRMEGDKLYLIVSDNGPGMEEETIQSIFEGRIKSRSTGIGLHNINERIKLMFGSQYGIHIESKKGAETRVIVMLPFMTR